MKQQKKLVLHFDLNKTILLADSKYLNQTKEECVSHAFLILVIRNFGWIRMG